MTQVYANLFYFSVVGILSVLVFKVTGSNVFHFQPGHALDGSVTITTQISSWDECVKACLGKSKCLSIQMETRPNLCRIFSSDTLSGGVELKRRPGIWYSEKKNWTKKTIDQRCTDVCSPSETCIIRETVICQVTECEVPPLLDNSSMILGSELSVGSMVLHTCPDKTDTSSVSVCKLDGQWSLQDFTCPTVFVCPDGWEMFQDSCYLFVDSFKSFNNAEDYCQSLDARLVHLESVEENTFLRNYLSGVPMADYWMGMTDEDEERQWKWYGTNVDAIFLDWYPGEAGYNRNENCAVFGDTIAYTWADVSCGSGRKSVCEMTDSP